MVLSGCLHRHRWLHDENQDRLLPSAMLDRCPNARRVQDQPQPVLVGTWGIKWERYTNHSSDNCSGTLVNLLNQRLLSVCRMDLSIKEFSLMNKQELVRNILSPRSHYRQTPEIVYLLSALIIDNQLKDQLELVEKTMQRLTHLRMTKPLLSLLKFSRAVAETSEIPHLASYYARVFEWTYDERGKNVPSPFLLNELIFNSVRPSDRRRETIK